MFGNDWQHGTARIVARDGKWSGDGAVVTYTYVADVELPSGQAFRATIDEPTIATDFWPPSVGDEVAVLVKGRDRKVKFDKDDPRLSAKAHEAAGRQAFEAAQNQPVGTPAAWATSSDVPPAVAAQLAQLGIGGDVAVQMVGGDSVEAQIALRAALAQLGGQALEPAATPEARLAKLQALHAGGLLTDAEYAQQRQRILDEI